MSMFLLQQPGQGPGQGKNETKTEPRRAYEFLNMKEAATHLRQTTRWMYRNQFNLIKNGVLTCRIPKDSPKGRLLFEKNSLDEYMMSCRITGDFSI